MNILSSFILRNLVVLLLIGFFIFILGIISVNKICKDKTERGKNTRLGLYALLVLSGGQSAWVYLILWIMKIDVCS